jgi:hypothetical protein
MKIIINESQLKQIIESEEKKTKLYNIPAEDFLENYQAFIDTYNRKNKYDGIKIEGDLDLSELDVKDIEKILNEVVIVIGDLYLSSTGIKSLGKLESVRGYLNLKNTPIKSLGKLESVGGYLNLENCKNLTSLGKLESVGGYLDLSNTQIESLGNLTYVGNGLFLSDTQIKSLGNLESVGGYLDLSKTQIESLGNLKSVGNALYLKNTPLGKKLADSGMSEEEIKNKYGVKGRLYI